MEEGQDGWGKLLGRPGTSSEADSCLGGFRLAPARDADREETSCEWRGSDICLEQAPGGESRSRWAKRQSRCCGEQEMRSPEDSCEALDVERRKE